MVAFSAEAVGMPGRAAEYVPVRLNLGTASVVVIEKKNWRYRLVGWELTDETGVSYSPLSVYVVFMCPIQMRFF